MSASWPECTPPCLPCSCTDLLSHGLTGLHSPHANTQLNTDKATLLDLSLPVSLAKCVNHSLSVPPLPSFWTCLHDSILLFYLSPNSPHPIPHSASIAPWEGENGPSCCAQVCLSEVTVRMCVFVHFHEGMKERKRASENTITEQVSLHLCRSQLTFSSLSESVSFCHTHPVPHTFTQGRLLQGSVTLATENAAMSKSKGKGGIEQKEEGNC